MYNTNIRQYSTTTMLHAEYYTALNKRIRAASVAQPLLSYNLSDIIKRYYFLSARTYDHHPSIHHAWLDSNFSSAIEIQLLCNLVYADCCDCCCCCCCC